ncbi:NAD(P)-dependent oxidoreductase [Paracoccus sediminis]|uniref:NAD(P)-dependent oxidoreductase n=1 Tax=Paracoccus sediminis TaxID=1214787 RepID=A0A238URZ4_9RHOB|nr:NAD(P)-dependent oxidoreductase [Paracoccus sediminis]TBN52943.1 NAD(P)-dependent oxidoreductase [Paracoccus sediminis]SNR24213.1 Nucleoside-diphosphate-sugar epimerase [Paracoccus sediminis]
MRIALTGASGIVGGFVLRAAQMAGHQVTRLDRSTGFHLGDAPDLGGHEALVHCAFAHAPGRYRGGEGDDPQTFLRLNGDGTRRLFDAAVRDGVGRVVFLSSRAVHDGHPPGMVLPDDLPARPANLYGRVKAEAETHLASLPVKGTAIRATGVYGVAGKWRGLFGDYLAGRPIPPRVATEVHGDDLAAAILLLLADPNPPAQVNCGDLILDRHDLLAEVRALTGCPHPLPVRADPTPLRIQRCDRLRTLGWQPGSVGKLRAVLPDLVP